MTERHTQHKDQLRLSGVASEAGGSAFAREYADHGQAAIAELRREARGPSAAELTSGTPHPNAVLAGWQVDQGVYVRKAPLTWKRRADERAPELLMPAELREVLTLMRQPDRRSMRCASVSPAPRLALAVE